MSSFESVVSKLEKRSKNRASKKFVFDTRATAKERITRISSNNYNFLIFLPFAFGKDEVGGSNPPSSSKKHRKLRFSVLFCCKTLKEVWVKMWINRLTHTVTHTRKCPDRPKEYRRGGFASSPVFLSSFCSHDLRHEATHGLCGLVLLLPCCVGVGAESEARIVVAQHTANGFDVHAVLQG